VVLRAAQFGKSDAVAQLFPVSTSSHQYAARAPSTPATALALAKESAAAFQP